MSTKYNPDAICASLRRMVHPDAVIAAELIESLERQIAAVPVHLSICASQDDSMAAYPRCDCGAWSSPVITDLCEALMCATNHLDFERLARSHCNSMAAIQRGLRRCADASSDKATAQAAARRAAWRP